MKQTKICPKCQSADVVRVDGYAGAYGSGNNMILGASILSAVNVNRYICRRCGFTEEWIDQEDIQKVLKSKKAKRLD